jgi:hypothetical protein
MLSGNQIYEISYDLAVRASKSHKVPLAIWPEDLSNNNFQIPSLGEYRPAGYRLETTLFVDSSGFGSEGEPALTIWAFKAYVQEHLNQAYHYAVIESGEFQVVVGVFVKDPSNKGNRADFKKETGTLRSLEGW